MVQGIIFSAKKLLDVIIFYCIWILIWSFIGTKLIGNIEGSDEVYFNLKI